MHTSKYINLLNFLLSFLLQVFTQPVVTSDSDHQAVLLGQEHCQCYSDHYHQHREPSATLPLLGGAGEKKRPWVVGEGTGKNNLPSSHPSPVENLGSVEEKKLFVSLSLSLGHILWDKTTLLLVTGPQSRITDSGNHTQQKPDT